jgi:hypothetical protein
MSLIPQAQRGPAGPAGPSGGGLPLSGVLALGNQSGTFDIEMGIVGTQKAEINNASIIESEVLELVNGASPPTIKMTTTVGGNANITYNDPVGQVASIDYADVNKKITVQSDAISLDAGGGGLVEMTAVGAVDITAGAGQDITLTAGNNVIVEGLTVNTTAITGSAVSLTSDVNTNLTLTTTGTGETLLNSQANIALTGGTIGITSGAGQNITVNAPSGTTLITGATTNLDNVAFISKASGTMSIQAGAFVNVENFNFNATTISPSIVNADMTLQNTTLDGTSATASKAVSIVSDGVGGQINPLLKLTNNNATGSVAMEIYKNKPTAGVGGDVLFNQSVYGKDSGNAKQEYTRITHAIRDGTAGIEDGSIEMSCFVNGAVNTFLQINGNENQVNCLKQLDMVGNSITSSVGRLDLITTSGPGGDIRLQPANEQDIQLFTTGVSSGILTSATSGADSTSQNITYNSHAIQTTGSITHRTTGASLLALQSQGTGGISIDANNTGGAGSATVKGATITLATANGVAGSGAGLLLTGNTLLSGSASGASGQHLCLTIGGVVYKIALLNP